MSGYTGPRPWLEGTAAYNTAPNNAPYPSRTQGLNPVKPQGQTAFGVDDAIAIGGIIASLVGTVYSNRQQRKLQNEYMEKQQQYAKENWQMENEYNLPANVKNRLMAAGLNPNLMYGQGAASGQGGTIDPVASPEAYFANPMQGVPQMLSSLQEMQLTQSQIEVNKSIASKNNAEAGDVSFRQNFDTEKFNKEYKLKYDDFLRKQGLTESEIKLNTEQAAMYVELGGKYLAEAKFTDKQTENYDKELEGRLKNWASQNAQNYAAAEYYRKTMYEQALYLKQQAEYYRKLGYNQDLIGERLCQDIVIHAKDVYDSMPYYDAVKFIEAYHYSITNLDGTSGTRTYPYFESGHYGKAELPARQKWLRFQDAYLGSIIQMGTAAASAYGMGAGMAKGAMSPGRIPFSNASTTYNGIPMWQ